MDCSAIGCAGVLLRAFVLATSLAAQASGATLAEIDDAQARLQYGFLTGDTRALDAVLEEIASYEADGRLAPLKSYQLAYGHWKLAQVHAQTAGNDRTRSAALASKSAKACVEHARAARTLDEKLAEAYALEAVCDGMPRGFLRLGGLTGSCTRSRPLRTALSLEPQNPRILLIEAMCAGDRAEGRIDRWRAVVDAFASSPSRRAGEPDWGEPEALVVLGELYLERGEMLPAREALEKALILAPDYGAARELLGAVTARAH